MECVAIGPELALPGGDREPGGLGEGRKFLDIASR